MIKAFWYKSNSVGKTNVGDILTPVVVEHFTGQKVDYVSRNVQGKLLAIGSIMTALRPNDVVWGTGVMRETDKFINSKAAKFLAIRGKLSEKILGIDCGVYGDAALLLPLIYNPKIEKKYKVGVIPHYMDKNEVYFVELKSQGYKIIDIEQPWKKFVDEVLSCESVISSSLHGIIIAEAYGIPATWAKPSTKILGNGFKFRDYLTGTGRAEQKPGKFPPIPDLKGIQDKLVEVIKKHYDIQK